MNLIKIAAGIVLISSMFSCENEVEVNAEFEEKTFVLGLIDAGSDTQFVKVTKTFLDDETGAVQLGQDPNNLYYDSLDVTLNELNANNRVVQQFKMAKILRPKESGLFTTERNEAYYSNAVVKENTTYTLTIDKLNGTAITIGEATVSRGITLAEPDIRRRGKISLIDPRSKIIIDERFEFLTSENVGEFSATMVFNYLEIINVYDTVKSIRIPLTSILNPTLNEVNYPFIFDGQKFFTALEAKIPISLNPPKRLIIENGIDIIIEAADADYTLYRDVNGPIDGLAQTRPDYTNIVNGIGLFASRNISTVKLSLSGDTETYIIAKYGDRGNLSEYRGFEF
tara:strand:- start:20726 stop:21745 length:1020 start_codon:yes stop_codon:yes gene_type:complete